jgi:hypothetical protein
VSLCANGSEPATGSPLYVWISWLDAKSWLGSLWGVFSWLGLGAHASLEQVSVFCATEPVQPTYPGDATVLAAARDPVAFETCLTYIEDCARWWVWKNVCVCSTLATGTCYYVGASGPQPNSNALPANHRRGMEFYLKVTGLTLYGARVYFSTVGTGTFDVQWIDQHAGTNHIESFAGVTGTHDYFFATPLALVNVNSSYIHDLILRFPNSGYDITYNGVGETPIDTTQIHVNKLIYQSDLTSGMTELFNQTLPIRTIICDADPNPAPYAPAPPAVPTTDLPVQPTFPCTTDANICELVNYLSVQVAATKLQVDLIQRQSVPFAFNTGTVHSGLSGSGSFTVAGLIGLLIQSSTVPTAWGSSVDSPARNIPSTVTVAVGTTAGDQDSHFCHLGEEVWLPPGMGAMTKVSYSFRPGCGGAITELKREP